MADDDAVKFGLTQSSQNTIQFGLSENTLSFSSSSPEDFIWNKTSEPVDILNDAQVVSELTEEYIGYDPLNRDRLEIRIYSAKTVPERIALGTGYGRLLASKWGALNFGVYSHSHDFGEVLGGSNSSGVMIVNRISVMRRGEYLLIIRSKFDADYFDQYKDQIARFVGSIGFSEHNQNGLANLPLKTAHLFKDDPNNSFKYSMPRSWKKVVPADGRRQQGEIDLWIDQGDNLGNSAASVFILRSSKNNSKDAKNNIDSEHAARLARFYAGHLFETAFAGKSYKLKSMERTNSERFTPITFYNELFKFSVDLELEDNQGILPMIVSVMITVGSNGTANVTVVLTTEYSNDYRFGTKNHAEFVHELLMDAQEKFWQAKAD